MAKIDISVHDLTWTVAEWANALAAEQEFREAAEQELATSQARLQGVLDAYHASYRHGPDPDPKRCPACHAASLED